MRILSNANQDAVGVKSEVYLKALMMPEKENRMSIVGCRYISTWRAISLSESLCAVWRCFRNVGGFMKPERFFTCFFPGQGNSKNFIYLEDKNDKCLIYVIKSIAVSRLIHDDFWSCRFFK